MRELLAETTPSDELLKAVSSLTTEWAPKIFLALATIIIGWKLSTWVGAMVSRRLNKYEVDETLVPFLRSLVSTLIKAGVIISAISTLGVEATAFAAIFAAVGLSIGMALSGTLQNLAGGVIILILRPFKLGDVIQAQGFTGKVESIKIFETSLLTPDNKVIHIPNSKLHNDSLVNFSTKDSRRVDLTFRTSYEDDIEKTQRVIRQVIDGLESSLQDPEPFVRVEALAEHSIDFAVRVWVKAEDYGDLHHDLLEKVKKAFDKEGIKIPLTHSLK